MISIMVISRSNEIFNDLLCCLCSRRSRAKEREGKVNRKQVRAIKHGRAKKPNLNDPKQAQEMLENLPIATLVAGINNSLDILQKRGITITDWDQKKRKLYKLKVFGGKIYFLAAELELRRKENIDGTEK